MSKKINTAQKADVAELYSGEVQYNCSMCGEAISKSEWQEHNGLCEKCDKDYRR